MDIVANSRLLDCKVAKFPFSKGIKLSTDQGEVMNDLEQFRRVISRHLDLKLIRPDMSYLVQQLSQFMSCARQPH